MPNYVYIDYAKNEYKGEYMQKLILPLWTVTVLILMIFSLSYPAFATNKILVNTNPNNGVKTWSWEGNGLAIELLQVNPDFIRATYASRGLPKTVTEAVATRCVFGTIIRNISDNPLKYKVSDWRYITPDGTENKIKTKTEWVKEWRAMGVRFSWSILADDPTFEVGDWIQGFTTMAEPHGSDLDLKVVWKIEGKRYEKILPELQCAQAPID